MNTNKLDLRFRIQKILRDHNNTSIYAVAGGDDKMRVKLTRQINGETQISSETVEAILDYFPDVSAEWLMRGEGLQERTKIVLPQQRQDIHLATGARAAISQSGSATIEPDEPIGQESLSALLDEKDERIEQLEKDLAILKDAIRVLSVK